MTVYFIYEKIICKFIIQISFSSWSRINFKKQIFVSISKHSIIEVTLNYTYKLQTS